MEHRTPLDRARDIRLILFDVDGVLTDGAIWYFPGPGGLTEVKGFSAHDGIGIVLARRAGLKTGVITKRTSEALALRARDLRMDFVRQGVERKFDALREIWRQTGYGEAQTCCVGDDLVDLPMMRRSGLAAAPANARPEVLAAAHFIAPHAGGQGAARDVIDFILQAQGVWEAVYEKYLEAPDPESADAAVP